MARTIEPYKGTRLPDRFLRWLEVLRERLRRIPCFTDGDGSPEGVVIGQRGDLYFDNVGLVYYTKTTDVGNTGWVILGGSGIVLAPGAVDADFASVELLVPFDGDSGATAETDRSNAGRPLTFLGGAVLSQTVSFFGDTSLLLNGGDRISVPNDPLLIPNVAYTIEANFQISSTGKGLNNTHSIVGNRTTGSQHGWLLRVNGTNQVAMFGYSSGNPTPVINMIGTTVLAVDTPYHVAASRDAAGNWDLSLDGVLEDSAIETAVMTNTTNPLLIGRDIVSNARDFEGFLGNIRLTRNVDRYTTFPFAPPAAKFAESLADPSAFRVGDISGSFPLELYGSEILVPDASMSPGFFRAPNFTTAQLVSITNNVNTSVNKQEGTMVFNETTNRPVWAVGSADADVWVDATGATVHTPV